MLDKLLKAIPEEDRDELMLELAINIAKDDPMRRPQLVSKFMDTITELHEQQVRTSKRIQQLETALVTIDNME